MSVVVKEEVSEANLGEAKAATSLRWEEELATP